MIVNKNPTPFLPNEDKNTEWKPITTESELYEANPLSEIYRAIESIVREIKVNPDDPDSPPLFRTIKLNHGQLARIKHDTINREYALAFPACFIHLINVRWLVQTSRLGEGRADLRICFVLNRLNVEDDEFQTEGYDVFQTIHNAITLNKSRFAPLTERCQLTYFDQVENFDDGLQQYWITYEVWFKNYSTYRYKNYVDRYLVVPPFTNHSDQDEDIQPLDHVDHDEPTADEVSSFTE